MKVFNKSEKKILKQIASFYGCEATFDDSYPGGAVWENKIVIGNASSTRRLFSLFFHELAHVINFQTNKYPLYHKHYGSLKDKFSSYDRFIHYALQAEIYTEKIGAKLMKTWFPEMKYEGYYKNTKFCKEFLYGYYL